ncbi:MAG: dicarboxylate/amino acid:cation symporter [Vampirovibrionales bacterium]
MSRFIWMVLLAIGLGTKRHWHILFAILLGSVLGAFCQGEAFKPLIEVLEVVGQAFMRLINMLILPLVVSSLIVGVTGLRDSRQLGRLSGKVFGWFALFMVSGAVIGMILALLLEPGTNLRVAFADASHPIHTLAQHLPHELIKATQTPPSVKELILGLIPANPIQALANMQLVPVVMFSLLFATALNVLGDSVKTVTQFFEGLYLTSMKLTDWIFVAAVPGVFALSFIAVATTGSQLFELLAPYMLCMTIGLLLILFALIPLVLWFGARINFVQFYKALSEAMMVAFGTASGSATLPVSMACCEKRAGISSRIASFVLPTGASINKLGTTLFEVVAVLFLIQAFGLALSTKALVLIFVFAIFASIATPAVPSAGLLTLAIVINALGDNYSVLSTAIALLWPLDRLLDMLRTVTGVVASCAVAALVSDSEGELNRDLLEGKEPWKNVFGAN